MRAPSGGGPEEVLLDGPALAAGKSNFSFGAAHHSPDHRLYAYLVDETGAESYDLRIRDIASGRDLPVIIPSVASFAWARDSRTLFYVQLDDEYRERFVYRHRIGGDPANDQLVYEEKDPGFAASVHATLSGRFVVISTGNLATSEEWLIDAAHPERKPALVVRRRPGLRYAVADWGDRLVILTNADGADDFKIVTAPSSAPARKDWRDLVPYKEGRRILQMITLADYLVRNELEDGVERLVIRRKADGSEDVVTFDEEAYSLSIEPPLEFATRTIRFSYSSPATPVQIFDYDMESRQRILRKQQNVPSGHDPSRYQVRRLAAVTADNEQVPITVLHSAGMRLDGSAPLFLEAYGAYGLAVPDSFDSNILSLVDRGFVYAIAHVRGGLEKGERWHDAGRREHKTNTFDGFHCGRRLSDQGGLHLARTHRRVRRIRRRPSDGGGRQHAARPVRRHHRSVPFVDPLNSMLDESLPLTAGDFLEWGDPIRDVAAYRTITDYAPYENVVAQPYPPMLVTAGISDSRVQYWEQAKWVAKIRATQTNDAPIVLVTRMLAGHYGVAGRFAELDEVGLIKPSRSTSSV